MSGPSEDDATRATTTSTAVSAPTAAVPGETRGHTGKSRGESVLNEAASMRARELSSLSGASLPRYRSKSASARRGLCAELTLEEGRQRPVGKRRASNRVFPGRATARRSVSHRSDWLSTLDGGKRVCGGGSEFAVTRLNETACQVVPSVKARVRKKVLAAHVKDSSAQEEEERKRKKRRQEKLQPLAPVRSLNSSVSCCEKVKVARCVSLKPVRRWAGRREEKAATHHKASRPFVTSATKRLCDSARAVTLSGEVEGFSSSTTIFDGLGNIASSMKEAKRIVE